MSHPQNIHKLPDIVITDTPATGIDEDEGMENIGDITRCPNTYSVTVSKKPSSCSGQKSFISIHSTDNLCQVADEVDSANLDVCNVEVLSHNEVFPSTSEESLSNEGSPVQRNRTDQKCHSETYSGTSKCYVPTNSKSSTMPRQRDPLEGTSSVHSDFDIPKSTMYVVGSNPGEPKMCYSDPPKKISKTMKKFLRNIDKQKNENKNEKAFSELTARGILKDRRCVPECTGDSTDRGAECISPENLTMPFPLDFSPQTYYYSKQSSDKNVTFNTQVVIIHFRGDLCVGQSVEALSKENDQQARNSEIKKTFLTKYNEFRPTQKPN